MKITIHSRTGRHDFETDGRSSLLIAGLANGLSLPYACASGTCGTCSARLRSGSYIDRWDSAPGRSKMAKEDEILLCQCSPEGDCELELKQTVPSVVSDEHVPFFVDATLKSWTMLTADVASWELDLDRPMDYQAGQFVLLSMKGIPGSRAYSIVNYERGSTRIELLVKKKPGGGFSEDLFRENPVGRRFQVIGPLGRSVFKPELGKDLLCIAGGSGIAGMMSILSHADKIGYFARRRGDVFFGVRTMKDAFFLHRLARLAHGCSQIKVFVCLSDETVPSEYIADHPGLQFAHGFVHEVAIREMKGRLGNTHAFVAGPPPAVDAAMRSLVIQGKLSPTHIYCDKFD
ncbi:2Fe-2S iron-sulfur cluster binding domain-containing protein [Caballeronia sp. GACF5]|uniref:2Fe-2S iron-sulfur cluster binding domain-containing protein n=1 Tax=Caballeronia sp. GACF5 TaxID=2921746 RepID=UPI0025410507|nr:2Fe-2S iron-sulfur cluster binding domain-containing protein [Caballeronia sp. GACF5]